MDVTNSQVSGFIEAMLGCKITTSESGEGDFVSPVVAAYLTGVLPEMVTAYSLHVVMRRPDAVIEHKRQRDVLCDFLDAVSAKMRNPVDTNLDRG